MLLIKGKILVIIITTRVPSTTTTIRVMVSRIIIKQGINEIKLFIDILLENMIPPSLFSAFGIPQPSPAQQQATAPTQNVNPLNSTSSGTNTTNNQTTASSGANNQQGQLPRTRISQLFVPISMNRSRRVIFRRSSG